MSSIIKANGNETDYDGGLTVANPTEKEVCEHYEIFGEFDSSDAPTHSAKLEAAVKWAEKNC